jgi:OOP family OmpA-OmpF porin
MNKQVLLAAAALALSGAASAQTYGVISAGTSQHDVDCTGIASCDKSGSAFKVLGGLRFRPNFALEGGYLSFGKSKASDSGLSADVTVNGFGIGGAFHHDFSANWNFVARLGVAQMKTRYSETFGGSTFSDSDSKAKLYGGLGVGYKLTRQMSLDAAWDFGQGEIFGEKGDVNAYSLGVTFSF